MVDEVLYEKNVFSFFRGGSAFDGGGCAGSGFIREKAAGTQVFYA